MGAVRVGVKAVIIQDGKVLATKNVGNDGLFYLMPGGGQECGEPLHDALRRECTEEIGTEVEIFELLCVRDLIQNNRLNRYATDGQLHQLELYFRCALPAGSTPSNGAVPDTYPVGVEWLDLAALQELPLFPRALRTFLQPSIEQRGVDLGVVD